MFLAVPERPKPVSSLKSGGLAGAGHDLLLQSLESGPWIGLSGRDGCRAADLDRSFLTDKR
jgi:hypothetical protein